MRKYKTNGKMFNRKKEMKYNPTKNQTKIKQQPESFNCDN